LSEKSLSEIQEMIKSAKESGLTEFKWGDFEAKFKEAVKEGLKIGNKASFDEEQTSQIDEIKQAIKALSADPLEGLSEHEILMAATPEFDHLMADKIDHQKKVDDEKRNRVIVGLGPDPILNGR
jgi:hypothetical protein